MDGIKIAVAGNIARVTEKPKYITSGTVGLPVEFTFDSHWDGLDKTAVFRAGRVSKIVSGLVESTTLPWEVLQNAHEWLSIGVYGTNEDGSVAIPTIWANVKVIDVGTSPDGDSCNAPAKAEWTRMLIGQSAYELAVALGFSGSEEKWIESLQGAEVELRCVDDMIQWRLQTEPEQEWRDLVSVAEFQKAAVDAAKRAEEAAKKLEGGLVLKKGAGLDSIEQLITTESGNPDRDNKPTAIGEAAAAFGKFTTAGGPRSFVINYNNEGYGKNTFTGGEENSTGGSNSATLGQKNITNGIACFTAGNMNETDCYYGATFGSRNVNKGDATFVGGNQNTNEGGQNSFLTGMKNVLKGHYSFLCGIGSLLTGHASFGHGQYLKVTKNGQTVFGKYNNPNTDALVAIGNGTADDDRSNAFEVHQDHIVVCGAKLTSKTIGDIATKEYIENYIDSLGVAEGAVF